MPSQSIAALPATLPNRPDVIFSDVDDTLTWEGELPRATFNALHDLREAGIEVVPVTGGSAGWCDCLLKTWPIRYIIGENGAFWMEQTERGHTLLNVLKAPGRVEPDLARLKRLGQKLAAEFPGIGFTQDQPYRITDIAFDIGQAVDIEPAKAQAATKWLREQGVMAKLSSIHINSWIGNHTKATGAIEWLKKQQLASSQALFIGDSPNDEAMFEQFECTVGVANIERFIPTMTHKPHYITQNPGGFGFAELATALLQE